METMHKVRARVMRILGIPIVYLLTLTTIIGTYQIATHYFFNKPSTVSEELLTYSFTQMALPAFVYVFGKRDHTRMGFLASKISGSVEKYLEVATDLLIFAFAGAVMVYSSISVTKLTMIQTTASLRMPMGYIYVVASVTGIIIIMFNLMNAADMLHTDFSKEEDAGVWMQRQFTD